MQRADDIAGIAATVEHFCLPMAADVGNQLNPLGIAHQHAAFVFRSQRGVIADVGRHQFMADVAWAITEKLLDFLLQQRVIKIDIDRQLRMGARELGEISQIGHPHPPN